MKVPDRALPSAHEQPTLTVEEAGAWCGLGRSAAYEAARRGDIPTLRFNRSLRVPTAKLRLMLGLDPDPSGSSPAVDVVPMRREVRG